MSQTNGKQAIKKLHQIYKDFKLKLDRIVQQRDDKIKAILADRDQKKIQVILKDIKK